MSFAITAISITAVSTAASIYSSEKSRSAQKKASRNQEGVRRAQAAREKMAAVREQRMAQAQVVQGAATEGMLGSSAAQGGYGAIGSLTSGNMQFMNQMDSFQSAIARNTMTANRYAGQAGVYGGIANLAMAGASMANTSPATPAASSGSGYGTQGGMSGVNSSHVVNTAQPWTNPL